MMTSRQVCWEGFLKKKKELLKFETSSYSWCFFSLHCRFYNGDRGACMSVMLAFFYHMSITFLKPSLLYKGEYFPHEKSHQIPVLFSYFVD